MFIYKICSMYNVMEDTAMGRDADSVAGRLFISRFYHNSVDITLFYSVFVHPCMVDLGIALLNLVQGLTVRGLYKTRQ